MKISLSERKMGKMKYILNDLFGWDDDFSRSLLVGGMIALIGTLGLRYDFERHYSENEVSSRIERKCEHDFFKPLGQAKCEGKIYFYDYENGEVKLGGD